MFASSLFRGPLFGRITEHAEDISSVYRTYYCLKYIKNAIRDHPLFIYITMHYTVEGANEQTDTLRHLFPRAPCRVEC